MKYRNIDDLNRSGELHLVPPPAKPMSQRERLLRWAELLEAAPLRQLSSLERTEYRLSGTRDEMRSDGSPLSVAFDDPVLRAEGLVDDTYGAARRFFGLSDGQLHHVICSCHCGASILARHVALRVRSVVPRRGMREIIAAAFRRRGNSHTAQLS